MEITYHSLFSLLPFFLLFGFALSLHIPLDDFEAPTTRSRALLQAKERPCKQDFESMNYTIITSKCKGPNYEAKECCSAFKDFACPLAEALNDAKTDCAITMFSYINLNGHFPPGIFANMCKEGKKGLDCGEEPSSDMSTNKKIKYSTEPENSNDK